MNKFVDFMERHFVPVAAKLASQKHLTAIRDAFAGTMPVMLSGAICVMLVNVVFADYSLLASWINAPEFFAWTGQYIAPIFQKVVNGSVAITSLIFTIGLAHRRAIQEKMDATANAVIVLGSLLIMGFSDFFNPQGIFVAMIFGLIFSEIHFWVVRKNWTIKMPDTVPPAISRAFIAVIPGLFCLITASLIDYGFNFLIINDVPATAFIWFKHTIQGSLTAIGSSFFGVLIVTLLIPLLWWFGIHGGNMTSPIYDTVYRQLLAENMVNYLNGARTIDDGLHVWTSTSFDVFTRNGGGGSTICLLVAILLVGKLQNERVVAKMAITPGLFNINEPVTFGIPTVLNVVYLIPLLTVTTLQMTIAYFCTAAGIIPPVVNEVPWVMPPVLGAFLATNGSFAAAGINLLTLVLGVLIFIPFVMISNRVNGGKEE